MPYEPSLPLSVKYEAASRYLGITIAVVSSIIILVWVFDISPLINALPDLMKISIGAAILFLICGIVLSDNKLDRRLHYFLTACVILIAGLLLSQDLFGWNAGGSLLTSEAGMMPGRMPTITAAGFLLMGFSLLAIRTYARLSQILALITVGVVLVAIVGYLNTLGSSYGVFSPSIMAPFTALLFFVLVLGVLFQTTSDKLENRVEESTSEIGLAHQKMTGSEALFAGLLESAPDALVIVNKMGNIVLVNAQVEALFGYQRHELLGQNIDILLPEAFRSAHKNHRADYVERPHMRSMGTDLNLLALRRDKSLFPVDVSLSPIQTPEEMLVIAVVRDITRQKETEAALAASQERLTLFINSVRDYALYMLDLDGNVTSWNEGAQRIKGYQEDEIVGKYYGRFFIEEDQAANLPAHALELARAEGRYSREGWHVRKDGSIFWSLTHMTPIYDSAQHLIGYSKITRDLSERKQAEDAIRDSAALFKQVLELLPVGVWILDSQGIVTTRNPAGYRIWQGERYLTAGQSANDVGWWMDTGERIKADEWASTRAVAKGETSIDESIEIECFDGSHKFILNSAIPIRDDDDKVTGAIVVNQDISSLKETEATLRRYADALEKNNQDLEQFVYMASHDLQEPLRKIQAFGDRLQLRTQDVLDETARDYLMRMINASFRMRNLIEDLLVYSRVSTQALPFRTVDLNAVVASVLSDLEIAIERTNARINVGNLATIGGDTLQLSQMFQNLISNALKFHKPDQEPIIDIHSRFLDLSKRPIAEDNRSQSAYVEITVADNGIGFDPKYADRIFKMFQRLHGHSEYEGTGIGLAICQKIVERHKGTIVGHGLVNGGATFVVTLPMDQKKDHL